MTLKLGLLIPTICNHLHHTAAELEGFPSKFNTLPHFMLSFSTSIKTKNERIFETIQISKLTI